MTIYTTGTCSSFTPISATSGSNYCSNCGKEEWQHKAPVLSACNGNPEPARIYKASLKPCPNHPDVLVSQCAICDGTLANELVKELHEALRIYFIRDLWSQLEGSILTAEEEESMEALNSKVENYLKYLQPNE